MFTILRGLTPWKLLNIVFFSSNTLFVYNIVLYVSLLLWKNTVVAWIITELQAVTKRLEAMHTLFSITLFLCSENPYILYCKRKLFCRFLRYLIGNIVMLKVLLDAKRKGNQSNTLTYPNFVSDQTLWRQKYEIITKISKFLRKKLKNFR